jgi:hypothetical protein
MKIEPVDDFELLQWVKVQYYVKDPNYPFLKGVVKFSAPYQIISINKGMITICDNLGYRYFTLRKNRHYKEVGKRGELAPYLINISKFPYDTE